MDQHLCGLCRQIFSDLTLFLQHKQKCAPSLGDKTSWLGNSQPSTVGKSSAFMVLPSPSDPHPMSSGPALIKLQPSKKSQQLPPDYRSEKGKSSSLNHEGGPEHGVKTGSHQKVQLGKRKAAYLTASGIPEKHFVCDMCTEAAFTHEKDLIRHKRVHTGEKPFRCQHCEKSYSRSDKLRIHERTHTGQRPYTCDQCDFASKDCTTLKKHKMTHTKEKPYKCQLCPYATSLSYSLVTHLRTHTGDTPYHCPQCPAKFKVTSDLNRHTRIHTGDKPHICPIEDCGYRTTTSGNLKTHVSSQHRRQGSLSCDRCHVSTWSKASLALHKRKIHGLSLGASSDATDTSPRPAKRRCEVTEKKGKRSGSRFSVKFQCPQCEASFVQEGSLRAHLHTHSPEPTETWSDDSSHDLPVDQTLGPAVDWPAGDHMMQLLAVVEEKLSHEYGTDEPAPDVDHLYASRPSDINPHFTPNNPHPQLAPHQPRSYPPSQVPSRGGDRTLVGDDSGCFYIVQSGEPQRFHPHRASAEGEYVSHSEPSVVQHEYISQRASPSKQTEVQYVSDSEPSIDEEDRYVSHSQLCVDEEYVVHSELSVDGEPYVLHSEPSIDDEQYVSYSEPRVVEEYISGDGSEVGSSEALASDEEVEEVQAHELSPELLNMHFMKVLEIERQRMMFNELIAENEGRAVEMSETSESGCKE